MYFSKPFLGYNRAILNFRSIVQNYTSDFISNMRFFLIFSHKHLESQNKALLRRWICQSTVNYYRYALYLILPSQLHFVQLSRCSLHFLQKTFFSIFYPSDFATKVKQINSESNLIYMSSFAGPSYLTVRSSVYIILI